MDIFIVLPDQLFYSDEVLTAFNLTNKVYIVEEPKYFNGASLTRAALIRSMMWEYYRFLRQVRSLKAPIEYIHLKNIPNTFIEYFARVGAQVNMWMPTNHWWELNKAKFNGLPIKMYPNPGHIFTRAMILEKYRQRIPSEKVFIKHAIDKLLTKNGIPESFAKLLAGSTRIPSKAEYLRWNLSGENPHHSASMSNRAHTFMKDSGAIRGPATEITIVGRSPPYSHKDVVECMRVYLRNGVRFYTGRKFINLQHDVYSGLEHAIECGVITVHQIIKLMVAEASHNLPAMSEFLRDLIRREYHRVYYIVGIRRNIWSARNSKPLFVAGPCDYNLPVGDPIRPLLTRAGRGWLSPEGRAICVRYLLTNGFRPGDIHDWLLQMFADSNEPTAQYEIYIQNKVKKTVSASDLRNLIVH